MLVGACRTILYEICKITNRQQEYGALPYNLNGFWNRLSLNNVMWACLMKTLAYDVLRVQLISLLGTINSDPSRGVWLHCLFPQTDCWIGAILGGEWVCGGPPTRSAASGTAYQCWYSWTHGGWKGKELSSQESGRRWGCLEGSMDPQSKL